MRSLRGAFAASVILLTTVMLGGVALAVPAQGAPAQSEGPANGRASIEFTVTPRGEPAIGDLMTWDYEIINHTSFGLEHIVISDDLEGQICYVGAILASQAKTCSLATIAGPTGYEANAKVTATAVAADGSVIREIEADLVRVYEVNPAPTAPEDLAFADSDGIDEADPSWPIDRWAPFVVIGAILAGVAIAAFRLQPEPERVRGSR